LVRLNVDLGTDALTGLSTTVVISPDGRRLVYPARGPDGKQQFATRLLEQAQHTLLPGTVGGQDPFFSPDGKWVGFFADGKLKKISVEGGTLVVLCDATNPRGGSWGEDGNIVAALTQVSPLSRLPEAGGIPQLLTKLTDGAITHRWPQVLPGGRAVLFTTSATSVGLDDAEIGVIALKTGATKIVHSGGYYGRYVPSGHLVYVHQGVLFGVAFDVDRLEIRGAPVPLADDVAAFSGTGGGEFDFSPTGTFMYETGRLPAQGWPIVWLDSFGNTQPLLNTPGAYYTPRFSPDGRRLALGVSTKGSDIFVFDWRREATARLTFDGHSTLPVWSPDGRYIAFRSGSGGFGLWIARSDGAGEPQRLLETRNSSVPWSFSPDGRLLAYHEVTPETGFDLWVLPIDTHDPDHPKAGSPRLFLRTPFNERRPTFSPDGRWIAYDANESGVDDVYVRPFPEPGGKWQISTGGGTYPHWSQNGHELFFEAADQRIMVVEYSANGNSFIPAKPRVWSDRKLFNPGLAHADLAPDGSRFAILAPLENADAEKGSVHVTFLLNFFDELRRRVPNR
jgi:serine/threonine-protein kinase